MAVTTKYSQANNQVTIAIDNRFDFSLHQQFRNAYNQFAQKNLEFILDLTHANYMDSSALGMILLLKDFVEINSGSLIIRKPNESVKKILEIAQFHRLMTIEP